MSTCIDVNFMLCQTLAKGSIYSSILGTGKGVVASNCRIFFPSNLESLLT